MAVDQVNDVTNVSTVDTVNTVASVTNVVAVDQVNDVTNVSTVDTVNTVTVVTNVTAVDAVIKETTAFVIAATANSGAVNTPAQLATYAANKFVIVRSRDDNDTDNPLWVGKSNVDAELSANGYPLDAGESIKLPVENANEVWVDSQAANQNYSLVVV